MGIWVIVCVQEPSHHFLQTFRPLRMLLFKIVFRGGSLYPKQLFYFVWSAQALTALATSPISVAW